MCCKIIKNKKINSGQSLIEYVLMMFIISAAAFILFGPMKKMLAMMEKPLRQDYRRVYKYGDPKGCGYNDQNDDVCSGEPQRHPRIYAPDNFRTWGRKS